MTREPGREALAAIVAGDDGWEWIIPAMKKRLETMSTSAAAKQIGISKATVSRVSRGAEPTVGHYFQIKRWLSPPALYSAAQLAKVEARATTAEARAEAAEERVAVLEEALRQMLPPDLPWKRDADGVLIHHKVAAINDARNALKREIQNADQ